MEMRGIRERYVKRTHQKCCRNLSTQLTSLAVSATITPFAFAATHALAMASTVSGSSHRYPSTTSILDEEMAVSRSGSHSTVDDIP